MWSNAKWQEKVSTCNVQAYATQALYKCTVPANCRETGVVPLDSLPAQWWNSLWNEITTRLTEPVAEVVNMLYEEVSNVVTSYGITLSDSANNQLLSAIKKALTTIGTDTVAGAVKSSTSSGKLWISSGGTACINCLGTITDLTCCTNVVDSVNHLYSLAESNHTTFQCSIDAINSDITGLRETVGNLQRCPGLDCTGTSTVPTNHASACTDYGQATVNEYGHVKLCTAAANSNANGVAATPGAIYAAIGNRTLQCMWLSGTTLCICLK